MLFEAADRLVHAVTTTIEVREQRREAVLSAGPSCMFCPHLTTCDATNAQASDNAPVALTERDERTSPNPFSLEE